MEENATSWGKIMKTQMIKIAMKVKWVNEEASKGLNLPSYQSEKAAGMDVEAAVWAFITIHPGCTALIPTGLAVAIPEGFELQVRPRSGLAVKHNITVINAPGTIDSDYRGELKVALINHGKQPFMIYRGDRIAQLVLAPVCQAALYIVDELDSTERGSGGFGHTGA